MRFSVWQIICQMATDVNRNVSDVVVQKSILLTMPVLIGYFKVTWYLTMKLFSSISLNLWRHKVTFRRSPNFDCSLWYISLICPRKSDDLGEHEQILNKTLTELKPSRMLPLFTLWSMLVQPSPDCSFQGGENVVPLLTCFTRDDQC